MAENYVAGDLQLESCKIVNYQGNHIDLRDVLLEFNVFTDMYSSGIQCNIVVADALGLIERLPIVGDEMIYLSFKAPTMDLVEYVFYVYKVDDRIHNADYMDTYVLHGCSTEVINNARSEIFEAFKNKKTTAMVQNIYDQYLKPSRAEFNLVKDKSITFDDSLGDHTFLGARMAPFKAISYLSRESFSNGSTPSNYVFYENEDGWFFRDINKLLVQDSKFKFYYAQTAIEQKALEAGENPIFPYQKIVEIEYPQTKDVLFSMKTGYYDNEVNTFDFIRKSYTSRSFSIDESFGDFNHLGSGRYVSENSPMKRNTGNSLHRYFATEEGSYSQTGYFSRARGNDSFMDTPRTLQNFYSQKISARGSMDNIAVHVTVPGNSNIRIGDVIDVFIQQNSADVEFRKKNNVLLGSHESAQFLVVQVRHLFNKEQNAFHTILRCVKDTYAKQPVELA